jgi:hypothetical protein
MVSNGVNESNGGSSGVCGQYGKAIIGGVAWLAKA